IVEKIHPRMALIYPSLANYIWISATKVGAPVQTENLAPPRFEFRILDNVHALAKKVTPEFIQAKMWQMEIERETPRHPVMARLPESTIRRFQSELERLTQGLRAAGIEPVLVTHATRFGKSVSPEDRAYLIGWRK